MHTFEAVNTTLKTSEPMADIGEIAAYLNVSKYTARSYAKTGQIPAFKVGGQWRCYLSAIRAKATESLTDPWVRKSRRGSSVRS